ncbi:MAG: hypothetical protein JWM97_1118, partial [Phycisphaerales bacterium]|nr:hypothetical protein [Phycisphaerales bacterium]
ACLWGRPEFILTLAVLASWRTWRVAFTLLRVCLRALRGFAVIRIAALHRRRWSPRSGFLRSEYRSNVTEYRDHGQDAHATTCAGCPCHYAEYRDAWRSAHATDCRHRCLLASGSSPHNIPLHFSNRASRRCLSCLWPGSYSWPWRATSRNRRTMLCQSERSMNSGAIFFFALSML